MKIHKQVIFFFLFTIFNLTAMVEKLSDIKDDSVLMWKLLHKLKGARILVPGRELQETDVFPKDKKFPLELVAKILQEANSDALAQQPKKIRLVRELAAPYAGAFSEQAHLSQQLWLDNDRVMLFKRPTDVNEPIVYVADIYEGSYTTHARSMYSAMIPQENMLVYSTIDNRNSETIDRLTYNQIHHLPINNTEINVHWHPERNFTNEYHLSPDKTKYIVRHRLHDRPHSTVFRDTLQMYDAQTNQLIKIFPSGNTLFERTFKWSADNKLAIKNSYHDHPGSNPDRLYVYDLKQLLQDEPCYSREVPEGALTSFEFSPDGTLLIICSFKYDTRVVNDHPGVLPAQIEVLDAQTGKSLFILSDHHYGYQDTFSLLKMIVSPDSKHIVARTLDNTPRIYALEDKEVVIDYFTKNSEPMKQFLLFMLLRFNFNKEDLKYIKNKLPQHLLPQLESFLGI